MIFITPVHNLQQVDLALEQGVGEFLLALSYCLVLGG